MGNPGIFHSPSEGWAFIPAIGVVLAFGLAVIAVLIWIAGAGYRVRACAATVFAVGIGAASVTGLAAAATSFEQRYSIAFDKYALEVPAWTSTKYGLALTPDDVADLVAGHPIEIDEGGLKRNVLLRPVGGTSNVQLVGVDGGALDSSR